MKEKILAVVLLLAVTGFVITNVFLLDHKISETTRLVNTIQINENDLTGTKREAERIFEVFNKYESYISLTVSHDDLTNIEDSFVDMIGYLSVNDVENATVAKSRLIHSLEHLRRLSGFNIDSII